MKLSFQGNQVIHPGGELEAQYPVQEARFLDGKIVVIYDYMAFPQDALSMAIYFDPPLANKIDPPFIV